MIIVIILIITMSANNTKWTENGIHTANSNKYMTITFNLLNINKWKLKGKIKREQKNAQKTLIKSG